MPDNTIAQNLPIFYSCGPQSMITDLGGTTQNVSTEVSPVIGTPPNTSQLNAPTDIIFEAAIGAQSYG
jgi:hypothetical protein